VENLDDSPPPVVRRTRLAGPGLAGPGLAGPGIDNLRSNVREISRVARRQGRVLGQNNSRDHRVADLSPVPPFFCLAAVRLAAWV
jgi:hypothetical protein